MSNFNPKRNELSPQEWENVAAESVGETGAQGIVIGGLIAGLITAAATSFIPTGVLVAAWSAYHAYKKTTQANKNEEAIAQYGIVAHVLKGNQLLDYRDQVGEEETIKQLQWAVDRGLVISGDGQDLLENAREKPAALPIGDRVRGLVGSVQGLATKVISPAIMIKEAPQNLIDAMSQRIANTLVIGAQGSGKGLTISNALDAVKRKHPDTTIFYLDPKGDEKETGYFTGRVDILKRIKSLEKSPSAVVEWFKASIREFQALPGKKLLILDEATWISQLMKGEGEGNWFKSVIVGLVSVGDSQGWNIWILALNPNTDDIGIGGGLRSQLMPLALITDKSLITYTALINTQWLPKDRKIPSERIQEICAESPINRCFYYGQFNTWLPMPRLENFSGYDRDSRQGLEENLDNSQAELIEETEAAAPKLSETATQILEIIKAGKPPVSLESIRKSRKWGEVVPSTSEMREAIEELFSGEFVEGNDKYGYTFTGTPEQG
jgi:hypothetical protein